MSQLTATARVAARAPIRRSVPAQPLRVVKGATSQPRGGLFAALCLTLLLGGLVAVLMLNTALAQGSFTLHDLQSTSGELADTRDALTHAIDAQSAPAELAARARGLGMVPAESAAFLRLSDGQILGVVNPAGKGRPFTVVTSPTPAAPAKVAATGPRTTVTTRGVLTITTVVTPKANGVIETTVTTVNSKTRTTTSTTKITRAVVKPATPAGTKTANQPATGTTSAPPAAD